MNDLLSAKALLTFRADVNSINPYNQTPLDIAHNEHGIDSEMATLLTGVGGKKCEDVMLSMPDAVELSEGRVEDDVFEGSESAWDKSDMVNQHRASPDEGVLQSQAAVPASVKHRRLHVSILDEIIF